MKPAATPGSFIAVEGVDGSGKTTQVRLLSERLTQVGHTTVTTREPGGTKVARSFYEPDGG